eukprot:scaffold51086_cov57-Phaeocystis_antarctica.AAC.3
MKSARCGHHGLVQVGSVPGAAALAGRGELGRSEIVVVVVPEGQLVTHHDTVRAGTGRGGRPG